MEITTQLIGNIVESNFIVIANKILIVILLKYNNNNNMMCNGQTGL